MKTLSRDCAGLPNGNCSRAQATRPSNCGTHTTPHLRRHHWDRILAKALLLGSRITEICPTSLRRLLKYLSTICRGRPRHHPRSFIGPLAWILSPRLPSIRQKHLSLDQQPLIDPLSCMIFVLHCLFTNLSYVWHRTRSPGTRWRHSTLRWPTKIIMLIFSI